MSETFCAVLSCCIPGQYLQTGYSGVLLNVMIAFPADWTVYMAVIETAL
jgi:hypothetical protein